MRVVDISHLCPPSVWLWAGWLKNMLGKQPSQGYASVYLLKHAGRELPSSAVLIVPGTLSEDTSDWQREHDYVVAHIADPYEATKRTHTAPTP